MAMANGKKGSAGKGGKSRKAGAPRVYLTEEQQRLIISAIEAGGSAAGAGFSTSRAARR